MDELIDEFMLANKRRRINELKATLLAEIRDYGSASVNLELCTAPEIKAIQELEHERLIERRAGDARTKAVYISVSLLDRIAREAE